jgi:DNA-binding response OmpR family regulator
MDVVLVRWPAEEPRRLQLSQDGVPRLLLVDQGVPPPRSADDLEDWVRVPADEVDLHARVENLDRRARTRTEVKPVLDSDGVLRVNGTWVSLPPVEARLTSALLGRYGSVVSRDALASSGWPEGAPGRNALDVHVLRLRRRIAPLGLTIRTVRSRGYLLE